LHNHRLGRKSLFAFPKFCGVTNRQLRTEKLRS
jgi:hypothetical protein